MPVIFMNQIDEQNYIYIQAKFWKTQKKCRNREIKKKNKGYLNNFLYLILHGGWILKTPEATWEWRERSKRKINCNCFWSLNKSFYFILFFLERIFRIVILTTNENVRINQDVFFIQDFGKFSTFGHIHVLTPYQNHFPIHY